MSNYFENADWVRLVCKNNLLFPDLTEEDRKNAYYALTTNPNKELNELRDRVSLLEAQLRGYRDELHDKKIEIRVLRSLLK
jgi:hypothetical protein